MKGELPRDQQAVQIRIDGGDWQPATFQDGQFVDMYGLPVEESKVKGWRPATGTPGSAGQRSRDAGAARPGA